MRRTWMALAAFAAVVSGVGAGAMQAQSADWSDLTKNTLLARGSRIFVVTDAQPQMRHSCRIRSLDATRLVCSERFGRDRKEYRKEEVLGMVAPFDRFYALRFWLKGMVPGVGSIVAGALLSGPGAIAAIVVGSLVVYVVTFAVAYGENEPHEHLLYLQPGKPMPAGLQD